MRLLPLKVKPSAVHSPYAPDSSSAEVAAAIVPAIFWRYRSFAEPVEPRFFQVRALGAWATVAPWLQIPS